MKTSIEQIKSADGHSLGCYSVTPENDAQGGIVILQEIFGVTDQLKNVAKQYTKLGYKVSIPALFDRQKRDCVVPFDKAKQGLALMEATELDKTLLDVNAAVNALRADVGNVVVMGFCWGGGLALRCAQKLDINGAIVFYGTRLDQYMDSPLNVPVIGHFGDDDHAVPQAVLDSVMQYFPELEKYIYEAGHAFANDNQCGQNCTRAQ